MHRFTALPMFSKISAAPICEEVSTGFTMTSWGLNIFPMTLKEKQSPESLYGKITGFFFVICWPERFYVRKTLGQGGWQQPVFIVFISSGVCQFWKKR